MTSKLHPGETLVKQADDNLLLRPMASLLSYLRHRMQLIISPLPKDRNGNGPGALCAPAVSSLQMIEHCRQNLPTYEAMGATAHELAFGSTDQYLVVFDPDFAQRRLVDVEQVLYVLCHEIAHRMLCDPWWLARVKAHGSVCGQPLSDRLAQMALDARVNSFLDEMNEEAARTGLRRPPCGTAPQSAFTHPDITWRDTQDQAYLKLYQDIPPDDGGSGKDGDPNNESEQEQAGAGEGGSQGWGGCAPHEQKTLNENGEEQSLPPESKDFQNSEASARATAQAAIQRSAARGTLPLGLARGLLDLLRPPYDAGAVVRQTIQSMLPGSIELNGGIDQRGQVDLYRQKRERRLHGHKPGTHISIPPALIREHMGLVIGIADTSGSMSQADLQRAFSAAADILEKGEPERLILIQIDADIAEVRDVQSPEEFQNIEVLGGGGTDMRVAFAKIDEMMETGEIEVPDLVVIGTDGETPWPEEETAYPVLAMITRPTSTTPDWMERVDWPVEE